MEIYNKPDFSYREECFAILAINSWELLFKARILQLSANKLSSILKYERRKKADGKLSEKKYRVKNRSGTHQSIGMFRAIDHLTSDYGDKVHPAVRQNLELLCEVRDNAVHFYNKGLDLSKIVQELGTANLRNYLVLVRQWFAVDLERYNFFLMPLAFVGDHLEFQTITLNADERKLIEFLKIQTLTKSKGKPGKFNVALRVDVKFTKSKSDKAQKVIITNDVDATPVTISEEDIREKYPWDYGILTTRLRIRYTNFKTNQEYHEIRKPLEADDRYCRKRFLDPSKKSGIGKCFYNPNIVREFDEHYEIRN